MAPKSSSRNLNRTLLAIVAALVVHLNPGFTQPAIRKSVVTPAVSTQAVDRRGDFYLAFKNGTVAKYDTAGTEVLNYSPRRLGQVTLIDPWNPLKTFLFYEEFQSIVILDRFMSPSIEYDLTGKSQSFIRLACPSQDNSFWLIDESYNGLIKFDPIEQKIQSKIPFNLSVPVTGEILFIREYQNVLFASLSDGGIAYFDNLGSFLGKIEAPPCPYFGFFKNKIYLKGDDGLIVSDLYSDEQEQAFGGSNYAAFLMLNNKAVGIKKEGGFDLLPY